MAPEVFSKPYKRSWFESLKVAVLSAKTAPVAPSRPSAAPLIWVVPSTRPAARPRLHLRLPWTPVQRRWLGSSLLRKVLLQGEV